MASSNEHSSSGHYRRTEHLCLPSRTLLEPRVTSDQTRKRMTQVMGALLPAKSRFFARSRSAVKEGCLKGSQAHTGVERKEFAALSTKAREAAFELDRF